MPAMVLYHHGIKGQRWGVQNGPPYPLGESQRQGNLKYAKQIDRGRNFFEKSAAKDGFVDEVLIPYTAVAAFLAIYGLIVHKMQKAQENAAIEKFKKNCKEELENNAAKNPIKNVKDLPKVDKVQSAEENMKIVNPGFPEDGHVNNCTLCTAAMAMRENGYDVIAHTSKHGFIEEQLFGDAFNAKVSTMSKKQAQDITGTLSSLGDGAYGGLGLQWKWGMGGHSVFWKNEGGKTRIYDGQSGEEFKLSDYKNVIDTNHCDFVRLDNCTPTNYILGVVEARERKE